MPVPTTGVPQQTAFVDSGDMEGYLWTRTKPGAVGMLAGVAPYTADG
jgi:hypothetical protein